MKYIQNKFTPRKTVLINISGDKKSLNILFHKYSFSGNKPDLKTNIKKMAILVGQNPL